MWQDRLPLLLCVFANIVFSISSSAVLPDPRPTFSLRDKAKMFPLCGRRTPATPLLFITPIAGENIDRAQRRLEH